jgi:HlyD family secretion protein
MSKRLKWILGILLLVVILLVVLSKSGAFGKDEGTKVTAETTVKRTLIETVNASGKVYPEVEVKVSPDISGEVIELHVAEGDTVRRGQVLARIYADIYASQRDQASAIVAQQQAQVGNSSAQLGALKATLDQAESNYNRQKKLLDQKVISRAEFEVAEQSYNSAKANYSAAQQGIRANQASVRSAMAGLQRASRDVSRATLIAPMDGVVSLLAVKKGERVVGTAQMSGTEMMRIADLKSIEAQVEVGENDIPKVKIGDTAIVQIDAYNNRKFKGLVYKIANPVVQTNAISSTTVTNYKVHIRLLPSSYMDMIGGGRPFPFRPNMTASADIQTNTKQGILAVPLNAVTTRDKKDDTKSNDKTKKSAPVESTTDENAAADDLEEVVYVMQKDGTVKKVKVTTGIQDINYIEILSGLKGNEQIITGPYDVVSKRLKDGTKVKVVPKDELVKDVKKE